MASLAVMMLQTRMLNMIKTYRHKKVFLKGLWVPLLCTLALQTGNHKIKMITISSRHKRQHKHKHRHSRRLIAKIKMVKGIIIVDKCAIPIKKFHLIDLITNLQTPMPTQTLLMEQTKHLQLPLSPQTRKNCNRRNFRMQSSNS